MRRYLIFLLAILLFIICAKPTKSQEHSDAVAKAVAQGDDYLKQKDFDNALAAYRKADKLSHHTCAECFLRMFKVDRQLGNLDAALNETKEAVKAAGNDKAMAAQAHLARGAMLAQIASKPSDKKLKEAEVEVRQALALAPGLAPTHLILGKILIRQERDSEGILELKSYLAAPNADPKSSLEARRIIVTPIRGREPFAPDFSFVTLEGESLSNVALRGKVVLFDFWGTWCPPCHESLPMLLNIRKKYRDRPFQMVGVSSDEDEQLWKRFIASNHMDWPEYLDSSSEVQQAFEIDSFPTFIVLDRDGIITYRQSGWNPILQMELEEVIIKSLKRPSNPAVLAAAVAPAPQEPAPGPAPDASPTAAQKLAPNSPDTGTFAEGGVISGNVYRDDRLGFSYQLPPNWIAVAPEIVRPAAEKAEADARAKFLEQHPEQSDSSEINIPRVVFYASQSGRGDGQRLVLPCIRISVMYWNRSSISLDEVKAWEAKSVPAGWNLAQGPEEYGPEGQEFFRTELVATNQSLRLWASRIMTVTHAHRVLLEILTTDKEELERLASTATFKVLRTP